MALSRQTFTFRSFNGTQDALASAAACKDGGIPARLVQVPASMEGRAECGTALRTLPEDDTRVDQVLAAAGIQVAQTARLEDFR